MDGQVRNFLHGNPRRTDTLSVIYMYVGTSCLIAQLLHMQTMKENLITKFQLHSTYQNRETEMNQ